MTLADILALRFTITNILFTVQVDIILFLLRQMNDEEGERRRRSENGEGELLVFQSLLELILSSFNSSFHVFSTHTVLYISHFYSSRRKSFSALGIAILYGRDNSGG